MVRKKWAGRLAGLLVVALIAAGLIYMTTRPARLPSAVDGVPAAAQEQVTAALAAAGYTPQGALAWAGAGATWRTPGSYRVFFAAPDAQGEPDIFQAELTLDGQGRLPGAPRIRPLTATPAGAESAPLAAGGWLAFATRVAGSYQSITCVALSDPQQPPRVFAFARPADQAQIAWLAATSGRTPRLAVTAVMAAGRLAASIDPQTAGVEPGDGALEYLPASRGEQAWLPKLVSRVRELPFVGPEKIAFLENVFFTAEDNVTRWWHGLRGQSASPQLGGRPASPAEVSMPATATAPAEAGLCRPAACDETATPAVSHPTETTQVGSAFLLPATRPSTPASLASRASPTTGPATATDEPTARPAMESQPAASATAAPPQRPTQPAEKPPVLPAAPQVAQPGGELAFGIVRRAAVQPDPQRPYAHVELIDIDPGLLQIKMVPGTIEPRPSTGLVGTGVIPQADRAGLVAGFNGGFAAMHGAFGMMVDRKVYLPARSGVATLAVYEDGSIRMGTWGKDLVQTPDMVSYRQNCPPLIENGTITAETGKLTLWGLSVSNEVYLYRSGLGVTADGKLVYAAGKSLSAYTLARALQMAGAVYAMQLDVDEFHVAFITYNVQVGDQPAVTGHKLRDDMRGFDGLFLRPFQLDFFYLLRRPEPLARPIRERTQAAPAAGPRASSLAAVDGLPGQLAFASNRDGNWEIYTARPGQPATLRRLTDNPADDLSPAWAPDGRRLAFASRRAGNSDIYTLDMAAQEPAQITRQPSEEWAPAWSPDGVRLVYQSDRNGQSDIYLANADGSGETRLTPSRVITRRRTGRRMAILSHLIRTWTSAKPYTRRSTSTS